VIRIVAVMRTCGRLGVIAVTALALAVGTPAAAQPVATPTGQPGLSFWQPPPVNRAALPADTPPGPPPGVTYQQKYQCVKSQTGDVPLPDEPPAQSMLAIRQAQQFSTGAGVKVAVIDTGVNPSPFLTDHGRLKGGGDYIAPSPTSTGTTDCDGHGTLTAGIVAANTSGTEFGFTGVAPQATIYAIRQTSTTYDEVLGGQDTGFTAGTPSTLATAIVHAVNLGVQVITMSLNTCLLTATAVDEMRTPNSPEQQLQAAVAYAVDHDVVVVNSAGNITSQPEGAKPQGPGNPCASVPQNDDPNPNDVREIEVPAVYSDDLLSVAAVDPSTGAVSGFSVWGPWVNIAAPGQGIVSVSADGGQGMATTYSEPGGNAAPGPIQGTSFAAPYVAGVVALVRARFPKLTARQVIARIEQTAQHPSGPGGRNNQVGYGIVDPVAALTDSLPGRNGVPPTRGRSIPAALPAPPAKDWTAARVALIGTAVAVCLFLATLFVVRTTRRRRR
jgi:membrane-anchored mycosin MYCP